MNQSKSFGLTKTKPHETDTVPHCEKQTAKGYYANQELKNTGGENKEPTPSAL